MGEKETDYMRHFDVKMVLHENQGGGCLSIRVRKNSRDENDSWRA